MNKKLIFLAILFLIIGGLFYFLFIWEIPEEPEQETSGPTLFAKEDYKVEEREDGKYIVVEKAGLTCKVPENWDIKIEGDDYPEPEYWVDLLSPDVEFTSIIITKGCGISIAIGTAKKQAKEIQDSIMFAQEDPKNNEICNIILGTSECGEHIFGITKISEYQALKHISPSRELFGQGININIPISKEIIIGLGATFPSGYREKCFLIWEEFIKNIIIE